MTTDEFYNLAFCRNLGLVSKQEQNKLRNSRVAIVGLGGLGGRHFLSLVRMGIGSFNITDLDHFSIKNINRQVGATSSTVNRSKVDVMLEMAKDINPGLEVKTFPGGLSKYNAEQVLGDVDIIVDAIDMFSIEARTLLYDTAEKLGKTVFLSAPLGFSGTLHVFGPGSMGFRQYFDIHPDMSLFDKLVNFAVGISPSGTHLSYMDMDKIDVIEQAGPSLSCACDSATGLLTSEVMIALLGKRKPLLAPSYVQFDTLKCKYIRQKLRWGNRGPLQRIRLSLTKKMFAAHKPLLEAYA